MQCEEDERIDDDSEHEDPFIAEGLSSSSSDDDAPLLRPSRNPNLQRLRTAKAQRRGSSGHCLELRIDEDSSESRVNRAQNRQLTAQVEHRYILNSFICRMK
jgi:hypothetical protein